MERWKKTVKKTDQGDKKSRDEKDSSGSDKDKEVIDEPEL